DAFPVSFLKEAHPSIMWALLVRVLDAYREARKPVAINDTTSVQGSPGASNSAASERDRTTPSPEPASFSRQQELPPKPTASPTPGTVIDLTTTSTSAPPRPATAVRRSGRGGFRGRVNPNPPSSQRRTPTPTPAPEHDPVPLPARPFRSLPYAQDPRVPLHSPQGRPAPLPRPSGYDREGREERPVEYAYRYDPHPSDYEYRYGSPSQFFVRRGYPDYRDRRSVDGRRYFPGGCIPYVEPGPNYYNPEHAPRPRYDDVGRRSRYDEYADYYDERDQYAYERSRSPRYESRCVLRGAPRDDHADLVRLPPHWMEVVAQHNGTTADSIYRTLQEDAAILGYRFGSPEFVNYLFVRGLRNLMYDADLRLRERHPVAQPRADSVVLRPAPARTTRQVEEDFDDLYGRLGSGEDTNNPSAVITDPAVVEADHEKDVNVEDDEADAPADVQQDVPVIPEWALFFAGVQEAPPKALPPIPASFRTKNCTWYDLLAGSQRRPDLDWVDNEDVLSGNSADEWQWDAVSEWTQFWERHSHILPDSCLKEVRTFNAVCLPVASGFIPAKDKLWSYHLDGRVLVMTGLAAGSRNASAKSTNCDGWVPLSYELLRWCHGAGLYVMTILNHTEKGVYAGPDARHKMLNEANLVFCCPAHASAAVYRLTLLSNLYPPIPGRTLYTFRSRKCWDTDLRDAHGHWTGVTYDEAQAMLQLTFRTTNTAANAELTGMDALAPREFEVQFWGSASDETVKKARHENEKESPEMRLHHFARHGTPSDRMAYMSMFSTRYQDPANPFRREGPLQGPGQTLGRLMDDVAE
ncbi:hypothetical protein FOZ62_000232, partial [Perkinsus olseni]